MKRPDIPLTVLGGGAVGGLAGAAYGAASGAPGGVFVFGGLGAGLGLVVGSMVGGTWLLLATLLTWGKPDGPAADYDDAPPPEGR